MTTFGQFGIDAAVGWGDKVYFFRGNQYVRVSRTGDTGPGRLDPGYPRKIDPHWNFPAGFGAGAISAAMIHPRHQNRYYFFSRGQYIIVERTGPTGPGVVLTPFPRDDEPFFPREPGSPITAAIRWGPERSYFFRGDEVATLERARDLPGEEDDFWVWSVRGRISDVWRTWPNGFAQGGIDAILRWGNGPKVYVFSGSQYIRIHTASATGFDDPVDSGYPREIDPHWAFPEL